MSLRQIAENTGNTLLMSFTTNLLYNMFKNRSLKAKINMSYRNSLHKTKQNFANLVVCDGVAKAIGKTPNTFMGSFIANLLTERKIFSISSLKNGVVSGVFAKLLEKLQKTE